ncbi:NUDIX domain-containing protein [Virgibacillus flavescens]|uniref:NUDIX domain-containing protein n=1 Tax=Virgibacillus flavescens TaxID=1611422 RepID=UPI003D3460C7
MNSTKNNGFEFLEFMTMSEMDIHKSKPVAGSFAVIKSEGKYLFCYNTWRKQWELPAGKREENETHKACAIRELYEETGQEVLELEFKGLIKLRNLSNGTIKFNPVYFAAIEKLQPFQQNDETSKIVLWDLYEEIGYVDEVDLKLLDYVRS